MDNSSYIVTQALIVDTFREAMARKIFWGLFALSTALILFVLLLLRIDIVEGATATVSMFGGNAREMELAGLLRAAYGSIATFLYTVGMFLAVFASAGLVPSLLEPGRIELLLSKPVSRTHLLLGRYLGNLLVVSLNTVYLVLSVWLLIGWKTGIWRVEFLFTIATTIFLFAVLLSVVVLVGVLYESTALAVMVTSGLMVVSPVLAQHATAVKLLGSEWSRGVWLAIYYTLPKVYDLGRMTLSLIAWRQFDGWMPVYTSAAFGAAALAAAVFIFRRKDF